MDVIRVAVIGSAGRNGIMDQLPISCFDEMVEKTRDYLRTIRAIYKTAKIHLVSGSAALADHVAVELWLQDCRNDSDKLIDGLTLYLPSEWDYKLVQFVDTKKRDWKTNPGGTSNYYHKLFSKRFGKNSLQEIQDAALLGATLDCTQQGFHGRNCKIAESEFMIAFTTGQDSPPTGGTLHTWKQHKGHKMHHTLIQISKDPES